MKMIPISTSLPRFRFFQPVFVRDGYTATATADIKNSVAKPKQGSIHVRIRKSHSALDDLDIKVQPHVIT